MINSIHEIRALLSRMKITLFEKQFSVHCEIDNKFDAGRIFVQITYMAPCHKDGELKEWHGRKYYLSDYMTSDEIVKTCFAAFKAAVEHEILEGFKVDNITLFNPHIDFEELLKISYLEVSRKLTAGEKAK